jgi:C1A family cysteine protease
MSYGLGWIPDLPDVRDFTVESSAVRAVLKTPAAGTFVLKAGPPKIDLAGHFPPVENQGQLGSCTANAAAGLLEYYERRALGRHVDASRLFVYKVSRRLLGWTGDTGAYLRTTMKALALFGAPPEENYPYDPARFDQEPDAFAYALGQAYKAIQYYKLDPAGTVGPAALDNLKARLVLEQPAMFGFTVYASIDSARSGLVPFPRAGDKVVGGHAVCAVGFDDAIVLDGVAGAIKFRNSWGVGWGQGGYGWLPYRYFTQRLAQDIWSLVRASYVDLEPFV